VKLSVRKMAVAGLLGAVSLVMGTVPWLGYIPVPTLAGSITIMHVPAILAGVVEGPLVGFFVGLIFGLTSLLRATVPAFADPLVAILPRLFIGVAAGWTFLALQRLPLTVRLAVAGVVGTATNTVLVLGMMVLRGYLPAKGVALIALTHGTPEVIMAAVIVTAVGLALSRAGIVRRGGSNKSAA
jgi:uncharacterized membrane protein